MSHKRHGLFLYLYFTNTYFQLLTHTDEVSLHFPFIYPLSYRDDQSDHNY